MKSRKRPNVIHSVACSAALLMALTNAQIGAAQELPKNLVVHNSPRPVASIKFKDEKGQTRSLVDFKGKVVVLNIWATWCVPCRKEMPTLDRLQAKLRGSDFEVVPLSIDVGGLEKIRAFYAEVKIRNLAIYTDTSGQATHALGALGIPTTLIVNRAGQEVGRLIGPAVWDAPEMVAFVRCIISQDNESQPGRDSRQAVTPPCAEHGVDLPAAGTPINGQP